MFFFWIARDNSIYMSFLGVLTLKTLLATALLLDIYFLY